MIYTIEIHYTSYIVKMNGKRIGEKADYSAALDLCTNLNVKVRTVDMRRK